MEIRKALQAEATQIIPFILLAMDDILYEFIGEKSAEKALRLLQILTAMPGNQYSYENCWVLTLQNRIVALAIVYDGAQLQVLRRPVQQQMDVLFGRLFTPEDETQLGEFYLDCLAVLPTEQGKGLGTRLLQFLLHEYVSKQSKNLGLLVDCDNPDAKRLYLRLGFVSVGQKSLANKRLEHLQFCPPIGN